MHITHSTVATQASHSFSSQQQVRLSVRDQIPQRQQITPTQMDRPDVSLSEVGRDQAAQKAYDKDSNNLSPYMTLVKRLLELMLGHEINISEYVPDTHSAGNKITDNAQMTDSATQIAFEYTHRYQENETAQYNTAGIIKTADGREIQFNAELSMARSYSESSSMDIYSGSVARPQKDPLILNFGGTAGQLSNQTFAFDIDSDGQQEQISKLKAGAAFLMLDRNNNGKVDNGGELFGARTGDGFAELAGYDDDGNGWIDEGDTVFGQLKLWFKDDTGQDRQVDLNAMGIGAIYLGAAKANFNINDEKNNTLGTVRASGIYLTEAGIVGSLQQVDLSI